MFRVQLNFWTPRFVHDTQGAHDIGAGQHFDLQAFV